MTIGPAPNAMSMNAEVVAITCPRSLAGTFATARANTDGVSSAMPTASTIAPRTMPAGACHVPATTRPTTDRLSAARMARPGPSTSGRRAPTLRMRTTIPAKTPSTTPEPAMPMSSTCNGTKATNPAIPTMLASSTTPGSSPAGCTSRRTAAPPGVGECGSSGRVSGTRTTRSAASVAVAAAASHTAVRPARAIVTSASTGPMPIPRYRASDARLIASPRRSAGARSVNAVAIPTKKRASPAPLTRRMPASTAGVGASP